MRDAARKAVQGRPSRMWLRYLLYYSLIFLVPLAIVGGVMYQNTVVALNKEVKELHMNKLSALKKTLDGSMAGLLYLAERITADPQLTRFGIRESLSQDAVKQLQLYRSSNSFCDEIYLHYYGDPLVYSAQGTAYVQVVANELFSQEGELRQAFLRALDDAEQTVPFTLKSGGTGQEGASLLHLVPIPQTGGYSNGILCFRIPESSMDAAMQESLGVFSGAAYILDYRGNELVHITRNFEEADEVRGYVRAQTLEDGVYPAAFGRTDYSLAVQASDRLGWRYAVIMPDDQFFVKSLQMQSSLITVILIAVAVGVLLALAVWLRTYSPVKKLARHISELAPAQPGPQKHELQLVREAFDRLILENRELTVTIDGYRPLIRETVLRKLLQGAGELGTGFLEASAVHFPHPHFFCLAVSIRGRFEGDMNRNEKFIQGLLGFQLENVAVYGVDLIGEDGIALIVNLGGREEDLVSRQEQLAGEITHLFASHGSLFPVIGVGGAAGEIKGIGRSFIEARTALQYGQSGHDKQVVLFSEIAELNHWDDWYPSESLALLKESLRQGNAEVTSDAVRRIFSLIQESSHSLLGARCVYMDLIKLIAGSARDCKLSHLLEDLNRAASLVDFPAALPVLERCAAEICRSTLEREGNAQARLRDQILAYIVEHYQESSFSLEDVARHFYVSVFYLSRFFKEQVGIHFIDYVTSLKINEAKRLLASTELKVKEITERVGYQDTSNFIRKFRQQVGVTPTQYRASLRETLIKSKP